MPDLGLIGGATTAAQHPFTVEDIFADEGGLLKKRGKVMYAHDFTRGYGGWNPVHNATGGEHPRSPLSLVDYPARAMRLAAPGPTLGQGTSTDAILRLARPRFLTDANGPVVSVSFRYAIFTEYATNASGGSHQATSIKSIGFGLDTQGWSDAQRERQFFCVLADSTTDVNVETYRLRGSRPNTSTAIQFANVSPARASGLLIGQNENKVNLAYGRLTVRPGLVSDYIEMQLGGKTVDLRGITAVNEPIQWGATNYNADFNGGFNPFFSVEVLAAATEVLAAGLLITDICVTYGDELA
ncbi:hypothetical protein [Microbacterium oleivorans]|uniref:Uncharacterized protein n=1 Tax=Microbacterium oleivorans TaxID=273677 RepID=A0A7D5IY08_9MICO|nr:hypothetical protein [Microbacterium oleivorans]QLD10875.1 hypothetical protein HW566_03205 [Microbacterium oleivorans]